MKLEQTYVADLIEKLLEKLEVKAQVEVGIEEAEEEVQVNVVINPEDETGLLIGSHGSTLNAIQSFIALSIKQSTGEWARVSMDIGDWRQKHDEHLEDLATQASSRAKETGEPQHLYNLSPSQRRIVHMALSKEEGIETESEGEGLGRYLVIKKK